MFMFVSIFFIPCFPSQRKPTSRISFHFLGLHLLWIPGTTLVHSSRWSLWVAPHEARLQNAVWMVPPLDCPLSRYQELQLFHLPFIISLSRLDYYYQHTNTLTLEHTVGVGRGGWGRGVLQCQHSWKSENPSITFASTVSFFTSSDSTN